MSLEETNRTDAVHPEPEVEGPQPMSQAGVLAGVVLSWLGALISFALAGHDAGALGRICHAGSGCDAVLGSRFSAILGIPLPWLGIVFYLGIFCLFLVTLSAEVKAMRVAVWNLALWLCVSGVTFSAALMYLQFGVLRAFCPLCTASAVVMAGLVAVLSREKSVWPQPAPGSRGMALALAGMAFFSGAAFFLSGGKSSGAVVALVDGQKFTRAQMEEDLAISRQSLERERYAQESEWVRGKVDAALLASEAQRTGMTPAKLLADRLRDEPVISAAEIESRLARTGREPTTENTATAREEWLAEWRERMKATLLAEIAANHQVQIFLPPPTLQKMAIDLTTAQISGPANAAVQLVVFSDFQCQFCAQLAPAFQRIRAEFPGQVMVAFRYFPLEAHPQAFAAAVAAECAADQGAFWEYHDRLFAGGGDWSESLFVALATEIGLNREKFQECLRAGRARSVVAASHRNAAENGLEGVPAVFLNGARVSGKLDYEQLARLVKNRLKAGTVPATPTPRAAN